MAILDITDRIRLALDRGSFAYFHVRSLTKISLNADIVKVHLTPKIFFRLNKTSYHLQYFLENFFGFAKNLDYWRPVEVRKIGGIRTPFWPTTESLGAWH